MRIFRLFISASALFLTAACATTQPSQLSDPVRDPYEHTNRSIFEFNRRVDKAVLAPIAGTYRAVVPEPARDGVSNVMRNLREPWVFINDLLQGKLGRAGTSFSRFLINSTLGIGGLFKVSDQMGIAYHSEDFGQTLASWGVGEGHYLVVPFLGPSTGRDLTGFVANLAGDPVTWWLDSLDEKGLVLARTSVEILDARALLHTTLEELYKERDPYLTARSAYLQQRAFEMRDGAADPNAEDIFEDEEETSKD